MTVCQVMGTVAVAALLCAFGSRWLGLSDRARYYRFLILSTYNIKDLPPDFPQDRKRAFLEKLRVKYEAAASQPWWPVPPDPPPAEWAEAGVDP